MKQTITFDLPRIYVASLSDYNDGIPHGTWIDADQPAEAIHAAITAMLSQSRQPSAEEWAIHDYENFGGVSLSEYESIDTVSAVATQLAEHGEVFGLLLEHLGGTHSLDEAVRYMTDGYEGSFKSLEDYAEQFIEEVYSDAFQRMPLLFRHHIDFAGIGDEIEMSGDIFTVESGGEVHIFSAHV